MSKISDKRREVAARLRERPVARNINEAYVAIVQAIGVRPCLLSHEGESGDRFNAAAYAETLEKLADLIDPQERTCENVSENDFEFACSNCHAYTDSPNSYRAEIGYKSGLHNNLNYCPYCGARITEVD